MMDLRVNPTSLRLSAEGLAAADRKTDQAAEKSINKAMWYINRSAGAAVRPRSMSVKRELIENPMLAEKRRFPYLIKRLQQRAQPIMIPTADKNDPRRVIKALGLARLVFNKAASKFGKSAGATGFRGIGRFFKTYQSRATRRDRKSVV